MKNIMLVVPTLWSGGQERICVVTAELLSREYNVILVVFDASNCFYHTQAKTVNLNLPSVKKGIIKKVIQVIKRIYCLKKIKKAEKIDVSYSFGDTANIVNVFSKYKDKTYIGLRGFCTLKKRFRMYAEIMYADKVICISRELAAETRKRYKKGRITTLENPVDGKMIENKSKEESYYDYKKDKTIIMTVGRAADVKGYWHLIKAFSLVYKQIKNVELVHIGAGDISEYAILAEQLGIKQQVHFLGVQSNPFKELVNADIFVLSSCYEGFSNVLLEAMSLRIPVISTNCKVGPAGILHSDLMEAVSNRKEVFFADYGILLPEVSEIKNLNSTIIEQEEINMADTILLMLRDEKLRKLYSEKGFERTKEYSIELYYHKLKNCLAL